MKLIIGLWNPWDEYKLTRHNLGFLFLDYLMETSNFSDFKHESKFKWEISTWTYLWEKTLLLKPQTYMNLSGESIREVTSYYKLDSKEDIIVIYDDMSMDFWKIRYRNKGSAGGHNGIKNMIKYFGEDFKRLKVWIWKDDRYEVSDWVLSKFSWAERDKFDEIFEKTKEIIREKL